MPHKHRRDKTSNASAYELPPTSIAVPLPVTKSKVKAASTSTSKPSDLTPAAARRKAKLKARKSNSTNGYADDTPRAFQRLMQFASTRKVPSGLDDGLKAESKKLKRKGNEDDPTPAVTTPTAIEKPTIKPGEKMSDFSARVDAVLPLANLIPKANGSAKGDPAGLKAKTTKTEKKMQRMYAQWREDDVRIKEKRDEAREGAEDDDDGFGMGEESRVGRKAKKGRKKKRKKGKSGVDDEDDWTEEEGWGKVDSGRKRPLNDVVQAPPTLTVVPKARFRDEGAVEDVPRKAGSLRRREELGGVRRGVVEGYRKMMEGRRGGKDGDDGGGD